MNYTYEDLLPAMRSIVAEAGEDFVYTKKKVPNRYGGSHSACFYAYQGKPDCGIGHLLHKLGVPLDALESGELQWGAIDVHYDRLAEDYQLNFDYTAKALMESFQQDQDQELPWGKCLKEAITAAEYAAKV